MKNLIAQNPINIGPSGGFRGFGALGLEGKQGFESASIFQNVISTSIGIITVIAIIWFIIQLLTGAVSIIGSGGDKGKLEQARNKITSAIIGLVVVIAGVFILDLVGTLLGFPILNIANSIINLGGQK